MQSRFVNAAVVLGMSGLACGDWPRDMGPNYDGIVPGWEGKIARCWPGGGPRLVWSVELGRGWAGPAGRDGQVYVPDRLPGPGAPALPDAPQMPRRASPRKRRAVQAAQAAVGKIRQRREAMMQDVLRVFDLATGKELWSYRPDPLKVVSSARGRRRAVSVPAMTCIRRKADRCSRQDSQSRARPGLRLSSAALDVTMPR